MQKPLKYYIVSIGVLIIIILIAFISMRHERLPKAKDILASYSQEAQYNSLTISYPFDGTLFPLDIVAPHFVWEDGSGSELWLVNVRFDDDQDDINIVMKESKWMPEQEQWESIKNRSLEKDATVTILGIAGEKPIKVVSKGQIKIRTSKDEVGAPLFYREVNLPFEDAVKDPSRIRWRFGTVSSLQQPPIILENLPVCGNCHSFCKDGDILAMDVDYANSKGSYIITRIAEEMLLATSDVITWNDYKIEDGEQTYGLLSQISPDGRYVVSTVKDKSVFVPMPGISFSQLFFPIKGILCIYDRQAQSFKSLPGADDPNYVQSNPAWSPDGKYIVFARSKAYDLQDTKGKGKLLLTREECREFTEDGKPFLFDLYRIPFNNGQGGEPEPIEGASNNGLSNYFAKYSPDGKWIIFCRAKSYMLLQPDSELYIIPAEGGQARRLSANTSRMNSWHSFSPNGRWLVFSSKAFSDYTQLCLTHLDEQGNSTPAILLEHMTAPDRAVNIPEFVNTKPGAIKKIQEEFLNDYSFVRAGNEFFKAGEADSAIEEYKNALELNPNNFEAHLKIGFLMYNVKKMSEEGMEHYYQALKADPKDPRIYHDLGMALLHQKKYDKAVEYLTIAVKGMPEGFDIQYDIVDMHYNLGMALLGLGKSQDAITHFTKVISNNPNHAPAFLSIAMALADEERFDESLKYYSRAIQLKPEIGRSPEYYYMLAVSYAKAGRTQEAGQSARMAADIARAAGNDAMAEQIEHQVELSIIKRMTGEEN